MNRFRKIIFGLSLPILLVTVIPIVSCMNDAGTSPSDKVTLKDNSATAATNPRLDFLVTILGILKSNISLYVDPVSGDTSYVIGPKLSDLLAQLSLLNKLPLHKPAYAMKVATIDTLMMRYAKQQLSQEGTDISSQNSLGTTDAGGAPLTTTSSGTVSAGLAKGAHTRWVHWTSLLDVKALTEVRQIKVYIKSTGSDALGPNWRSALRSAIANWTAQSKGTAISFVETTDINACDVVLRGAYGLGSDGLMSYVVWLNPSPYVERIPSYGGQNGTSVDLVFNIGYENSSVPITEKTKIGMVALANILNIGWIDTENWYWNYGDFTYIPGTLHTDGDPYTPGSSIMLQYSSQVSTPTMTAGDLQLFQTLYPTHAITAKLTNNALTIVGYQSFTTIATNVNSFQTEGDTLVYSTYDGKIFRRIGLNGSNVQMWPASGSSGGISTFLHSRGYLAVFTGSRIYTRTPTGSWVMQYGDGASLDNMYRLDGEKFFSLTLDPWTQVPTIRVKYLTTNPGANSVEWIGTGNRSVSDYQARNGILAVADGGNVWMKKDGAYGWNKVHTYGANGAAKRIFLSDYLLAFYRVPDGSSVGYAGVLVGGPTGSMQYLPDPMYSSENMDVCGDHFAFTQESAYLRVIDYTNWVVYEHYNIPGHYDNTAAVRLGGATCEYVTIVDNTQQLWAKYGAYLGTDYFPYQTSVASLVQRP